MSENFANGQTSYSAEQDNVTSEITYPQSELGTDDVTDIIDRLHIGTLRRDQLKRSRLTRNNNGEADEPKMSDKQLEEFYKSDGAHAERHQLQRQSSKTSRTSAGSTASGHSAESGEAGCSRHLGSSRRTSRHSASTSISTDTQEMGIETELRRGSTTSSEHHGHSEETAGKKERKLSTKDKKKKLFKKKSSYSMGENGSIEIPPLPQLPQGFMVKYMGKRPTKGLWGSRHTRPVVEDIIDSISKMPKGDDLPLVNLEVYYQGLAMRPHSKNKISSFKSVQIPIQFISYGLQDTVYLRIFCFIMVKEMSSQSKSMECHVYACDSAKSAKEMAACLALAFQSYSEHLKGGAFRFFVDIGMKGHNELEVADSESSCEV